MYMYVICISVCLTLIPTLLLFFFIECFIDLLDMSCPLGRGGVTQKGEGFIVHSWPKCLQSYMKYSNVQTSVLWSNTSLHYKSLEYSIKYCFVISINGHYTQFGLKRTRIPAVNFIPIVILNFHFDSKSTTDTSHILIYLYECKG